MLPMHCMPTTILLGKNVWLLIKILFRGTSLLLIHQGVLFAYVMGVITCLIQLTWFSFTRYFIGVLDPITYNDLSPLLKEIILMSHSMQSTSGFYSFIHLKENSSAYLNM